LRVDSRGIALPRQCQTSHQQRCGQHAAGPEIVSPGSQRNPILTRKTIRSRNSSTVCLPFRARARTPQSVDNRPGVGERLAVPRISAGPDEGRASPTPTARG
jgi:hypothetical protein